MKTRSSRTTPLKKFNKEVLKARVDACEGKVVISLLYHHMNDVDENHIAESRTPPWNFRVASALANIGNCRAIAIWPTNLGKFLVKTIENIVVVIVPYKFQNSDILDKITNKLKVLNLYKFMSETGELKTRQIYQIKIHRCGCS